MVSRHLAMFVVLAELGCGPVHPSQPKAVEPAPHLQASDGPVRDLLADPLDPHRRVEVYWARPNGNGRYPLLVFLHGHQEPAERRVGGRAFVDWGVLRETADGGVVAVAVSQPGYGASDGPADYCGPATQDAVITVLSHFRDQPFVDPARIVLEGISRGAIVAAMVASRFDGLAGLILISGVYDLKALYDADPNNRILENLAREAVPLDPQAFAARSPLGHVSQIRAPALVLSGARDPVAPPDGARAFAAALRGAGVEADFVSFPTSSHQIPMSERGPIVARFLNRRLKSKTGIN
jgi:dipeptidyl aminopeptidase/acylaminoacyl peptidase